MVCSAEKYDERLLTVVEPTLIVSGEFSRSAVSAAELALAVAETDPCTNACSNTEHERVAATDKDTGSEITAFRIPVRFVVTVTHIGVNGVGMSRSEEELTLPTTESELLTRALRRPVALIAAVGARLVCAKID
jgi:hypothetical protein